MFKAKYTKHFAERYLQRCGGDMELLKKIKREVHSELCVHVFDCLVTNKPKKVNAFGKTVVVYFVEDTKKLFVKTIY